MQTVTLELSDSLYNLARCMADTTDQSLETLLQNSLTKVLPPLDDVPPEQADDLAALALLDDGALWRAADEMMDEASQAELRALSEQQGSGSLSAVEQARLQELLDLYGRLMVQKAHAWLLLARRGYRVPPQEGRYAE